MQYLKDLEVTLTTLHKLRQSFVDSMENMPHPGLLTEDDYSDIKKLDDAITLVELDRNVCLEGLETQEHQYQGF